MTITQHRPQLNATAMKITVGGDPTIKVTGTLQQAADTVTIQAYFDGKASQPVRVDNGTWEISETSTFNRRTRLSCLLKPMEPSPVMVLVTACQEGSILVAKLLWA